MKIVRSKLIKLQSSKIQLGLLFCLISFNSHAFLDSIYDYFSSDGEEEAVAPVEASEDSGYTASAQPITTGQESFNAEIIACSRGSNLNISTPGISSVMSFMDGQFCDQSKVAAISRSQGNINVENACAEVFQLKADNVCQFDEGMNLDKLDSVMSEMRRSPEVREAEVEHTAQVIKNDLEKIQNLGKLHLSFSSNSGVLNMIKNKLNKAKDEKSPEDFNKLLEEYGMNEGDEISIENISAKAFSCAPNNMIGSTEAGGLHSPSEFDQRITCDNNQQSELIDEGKRRILESCNSSGGLCPEGLLEVEANSPYRLYESTAKIAIGGSLTGAGNFGGSPISSINDFGPINRFNNNDIVLSTLSMLDTSSEERRPGKVFGDLMSSPELRNLSNVQQVRAMRESGIRLTQERFTELLLEEDDAQREAKSRLIESLTQKFISSEASNEQRNSAIYSADGFMERELSDMRASGISIELSENERENISGLYINLATGANLAEDTFNRGRSFERMVSAFGLRKENSKPFSTILDKLNSATGDEADDLRKEFESILEQTPSIKTIMEFHSHSGLSFEDKIRELLKELKKSELELEGDELSNEGNLVNALFIGEMAQAENAIKACRDRKSKEWVNKSLCSSMNSPAVAATALKALFEGNRGSSEDTLSKALIYCGPILQNKFENSDLRRNNISEAGRRNSCFHISEVLYDVEENEQQEFFEELFGLSCQKRSHHEDKGSEGQACDDSASYDLSTPALTSVDSTSSCPFDPGSYIVQETSGGGEARPIPINIAQAAIRDGNKDITDQNVRNIMERATSKRMERSGGRRGRTGNSVLATSPSTGQILESSNKQIGPRVTSDRSSELYNDPIESTAGVSGMNASDYISQNSAIRARNPMTTIPNSSDSQFDEAGSFSDEFIGQENMLGEESSQLLARLRAKEEELDGKLKFYNDVLANREDSTAGESAAEKTLREEKEKLQAETRALEQRLREQRDATAALAASRRSPAARRSMSSITSGLSSSSGGSSPASVRSASSASGISDTPVAAPSPAGVAAVPSSSGPSRSIASVGRDYEGSSDGGVTGSAVASISLIESGGETHQLTNGDVTVYSSIEEAEGNIVGVGVPPSEAALNANGVILIPTETEGLFTKYVPVMEDDTVKTLDGEVEFEKVFQVWISDVGGEAPRRAPTRLQDFDFINSDLAQ